MISALPVINNPFAGLFLISIGLDSIGTLTHNLTTFPHYQMLLINAFIISDQQLNYRLRLETSEQTWDKLQLNQFNVKSNPSVQSIFKVTSTNYMYYFWVTIHVLRIFYYHEKNPNNISSCLQWTLHATSSFTVYSQWYCVTFWFINEFT